MATVYSQLTQAQDALKAKDKEMQQLQAQLKTAQGSFDQELKKLETQVADLQATQAKKVCFGIAHSSSLACRPQLGSTQATEVLGML